MKVLSVLFFAVISGATLLPHLARADVELFICHEGTFGGANWQRSSLIDISQFLKSDTDEFSVVVRRAVCNDTMPDTVCSAVPGKMFCRQSALRRMNLAASWFAYTYVDGEFETYEDFRRALGRPSGLAFRYADGDITKPLTADFQEILRTAVAALAAGEETNEFGTDVLHMAVLQRRIMEFNYAALIGHESQHMNGETCAISRPSQMERSGIFDHLLDVQTSDVLFCEANPNPFEITADRCSARFIERVRTQPSTDLPSDPNLEDFAQRAASDMIAFQTLTGFRRFAALPEGKYTIPAFDAYLDPVFRLALLAGSVSNRDDQPALCGDAASLFVHGVQTSFQQCPGDGIVSDELLALLPKGVEASWNGDPWDDNSITCIE